jgi:hypothetical protein
MVAPSDTPPLRHPRPATPAVARLVRVSQVRRIVTRRFAPRCDVVERVRDTVMPEVGDQLTADPPRRRQHHQPLQAAVAHVPVRVAQPPRRSSTAWRSRQRALPAIPTNGQSASRHGRKGITPTPQGGGTPTTKPTPSKPAPYAPERHASNQTWTVLATATGWAGTEQLAPGAGPVVPGTPSRWRR